MFYLACIAFTVFANKLSASEYSNAPSSEEMIRLITDMQRTTSPAATSLAQPNVAYLALRRAWALSELLIQDLDFKAQQELGTQAVSLTPSPIPDFILTPTPAEPTKKTVSQKPPVKEHTAASITKKKPLTPGRNFRSHSTAKTNNDLPPATTQQAEPAFKPPLRLSAPMHDDANSDIKVHAPSFISDNVEGDDLTPETLKNLPSSLSLFKKLKTILQTPGRAHLAVSSLFHKLYGTAPSIETFSHMLSTMHKDCCEKPFTQRSKRNQAVAQGLQGIMEACIFTIATPPLDMEVLDQIQTLYPLSATITQTSQKTQNLRIQVKLSYLVQRLIASLPPGNRRFSLLYKLLQLNYSDIDKALVQAYDYIIGVKTHRKLSPLPSNPVTLLCQKGSKVSSTLSSLRYVERCCSHSYIPSAHVNKPQRVILPS